jgi:toxin-antitoxin system, toxin component, bro family
LTRVDFFDIILENAEIVLKIIKIEELIYAMSNIVKIKETEILIKEYKGQRVVTSWDIAKVHKREVNDITKNFNNNKSKFIINEDYFLVSREEISEQKILIPEFIPNNVKEVIIFTKSGYLKLINNFKEDLNLIFKIYFLLINDFSIKIKIINAILYINDIKISDYLMKYNKFEEFFIEFSKIKIESNNLELKLLRKELNNPIYYTLYKSESLTYLKDILDIEIYYYNQTDRKENITEKQIQDYIIQNFNKIFPNYIFVGKEICVDKIGKIDILAKDKESGRDVIIEIKKGEQNPNKQLLAYAKGYKNPILIGITNMDKKFYLDNIKYISVPNIQEV